jgi:uncharacterized protein (DUF1330 family)
MKKGYWVVAYRSVLDESALKEYGKLAIPAIEAGGGKALIWTAEVESRESGMNQRVVVTEFESFEKAVATYNSAPIRPLCRLSDPQRSVTSVSSKEFERSSVECVASFPAPRKRPAPQLVLDCSSSAVQNVMPTGLHDHCPARRDLHAVGIRTVGDDSLWFLSVLGK